MTLPSVKLDCSGCFAPGQIGVALSRVKSPKDITVVNFHPNLCPPQPLAVQNFYESLQDVQHVSPTTECCKQEIPVYCPELQALICDDPWMDIIEDMDESEEVSCLKELDFTPISIQLLDT